MNPQTIHISLNGKPNQVPTQVSLSHALTLWQASKLIGKKFAVAINGDFIPRAKYEATQLNSDDQVDVVQAVGGG